MKSKRVPKVTIQRMALYVQALEGMLHKEIKVVSSEGLAGACNVNSSQIRKDLAYFGEFGVRGVGYNVSDLLEAMRAYLGIDREWSCALVGVGNLGRALLRHEQLLQKGFRIVAAFDCDPFKIGEVIAGHEIICTRRLKEMKQELGIEIGMIATPPERAQRAANHLIEAGVKGIINFAPAIISGPHDIMVDYVDFSNNLVSLAFHLSSPPTS